MNRFTAKIVAWLALLVSCMGMLAVVSLVVFFVSLVQDICCGSFLGVLNDVLNVLTSIGSAVLASVLHSALSRLAPRLSLVVLIGVWAGAVAVAFGSWLIVTGTSGVELASYYFFFGNGLIGIWVCAEPCRSPAHCVAPQLDTYGLDRRRFHDDGLGRALRHAAAFRWR
jgi:hypothetical protein